jgi:hypothetical protein
MFDVKCRYISFIHLLTVSYNFDMISLNPTYFAFQSDLEVLILLYYFPFMFHLGKKQL